MSSNLLKLSLVSFTVLLATASGCAAPEEADDSSSSEDEIRRLSGPEIAGDIAIDGAMVDTEMPRAEGRAYVYRAFRFRAQAGAELTASVISGNASDPVASILDASFKTLAENDDARPGAKDSSVTFRAPKTGTYYVAFRNKEGWGGRFYAKLVTGPGDAPAPRWNEGWPESTTKKYDVELSTQTAEYSINSTCQPRELIASAPHSFRGASSLRCTVLLNEKSIRCQLPNLLLASRTTAIAADGTFRFAIDESRPDDYVKASGSVASGGKVRIDDLVTQGCERNSSDQLVGDRTHARNLAGQAR